MCVEMINIPTVFNTCDKLYGGLALMFMVIHNYTKYAHLNVNARTCAHNCEDDVY